MAAVSEPSLSKVLFSQLKPERLEESGRLGGVKKYHRDKEGIRTSAWRGSRLYIFSSSRINYQRKMIMTLSTNAGTD